MLSSIISSSARIKILKVFMMNPDGRYYIRQLSNIARLPLQAVQRETIKLHEAGVLFREKDGNRIYFKVDRNFFLFQELKNMIIKTVGIGDKIREALTDKKDVSISFIYGSYAKNEEDTRSDIDIAVIGDISSKAIVDTVSKLQDDLGREINPYSIGVAEFKKRLRKKDHFLLSLVKAPRIFIKGTEDDFRRLIKSR